MNDKKKIRILIILVLCWVIVFTIRLSFFRTEERRVPLKYKPQSASRPSANASQAEKEIPRLLYDREPVRKTVPLTEVKNIFAPLKYYLPPPPKPEPPPPPPSKPEPPPPHPLEKELEKIEFMGKATQDGNFVVFLSLRDQVFQVTKGSFLLNDQLVVKRLAGDKIIIGIRGTDIEKEISLE